MKTIWIKYNKEYSLFDIFIKDPESMLHPKPKLTISAEGASVLFGVGGPSIKEIVDAEIKPYKVYIMRQDEKQEIPKDKKCREAYISGAVYMLEENEGAEK